jgi:hypothetical protein
MEAMISKCHRVVVCSFTLGAVMMAGIVGCNVRTPDHFAVVDISDAHGYHHRGYYDNHHDWHGGYYDESHAYHEDSHDWHR